MAAVADVKPTVYALVLDADAEEAALERMASSVITRHAEAHKGDALLRRPLHCGGGCGGGDGCGWSGGGGLGGGEGGGASSVATLVVIDVAVHTVTVWFCAVSSDVMFWKTYCAAATMRWYTMGLVVWKVIRVTKVTWPLQLDGSTLVVALAPARRRSFACSRRCA